MSCFSFFRKLIVLLLVVSTRSMNYYTLNDVEKIVDKPEIHQIFLDSITLDNSGFALYIFVGSTLERIKSDLKLPSHFDVTNTDNFTDSLFLEIYDPKKRIVGVFAVEENKFAVKFEENSKITHEAAVAIYTRELENFTNKRYSVGIRNFCHNLAVHLKEKPVSHSSFGTPEIILIAFLTILAGLIIFFMLRSYRSSPTYFTHIILDKKEESERREFEDLMAKLKVLLIEYDGKCFFNDYCAICFENFSDQQLVKTLKCSHRFHVPCIQPLLSLHKTCPICEENWNDWLLADFYPRVVNYHVKRFPLFSKHYYLVWNNGRFEVRRSVILLNEDDDILLEAEKYYKETQTQIKLNEEKKREANAKGELLLTNYQSHSLSGQKEAKAKVKKERIALLN